MRPFSTAAVVEAMVAAALDEDAASDGGRWRNRVFLHHPTYPSTGVDRTRTSTPRTGTPWTHISPDRQQTPSSTHHANNQSSAYWIRRFV